MKNLSTFIAVVVSLAAGTAASLSQYTVPNHVRKCSSEPALNRMLQVADVAAGTAASFSKYTLLNQVRTGCSKRARNLNRVLQAADAAGTVASFSKFTLLSQVKKTYSKPELNRMIQAADAAGTAASFSKLTLVDQVRTGYSKRVLNPNRMLQLSDECMRANADLALDPFFGAAVEDSLSNCPDAVSMTFNSLTTDYSVCPSSVLDDFEEACIAAGGKT
jgi:hypothetical protein